MQQTPSLGAPAAAAPPAGLGIVLVLLAFALGIGVDRIGAAHRFNLLALPMLGMLAWNLAVYLLLAVPAWQRGARAASVGAFVWVAARLPVGSHAAANAARHAVGTASTPDGALIGWRVATMLHAAAATLALGAIASMYLRGLGVEYRAGWESTFLDAHVAHRFVGTLLAPAAWLGGTTLPDEAQFAALRGPVGHGESAARWIHLYAITVAGLVVVPRSLLALWAGWQAHRLAKSLLRPPPALMRGVPAAVQVHAYSYRLPPERAKALHAVLAAATGLELAVPSITVVPMGGEDDPGRWLASGAADPPALLQVALFPLTATPERETHGAFVQALAARLPAGASLRVCVDETDFRQRFGTAGDSTRLEQRREAWRRMLGETGHAPHFADLGDAAGGR